MILTRSPLRISLAGGGSDLPDFFRSSFGEVLSFTINKYVYVASHSLFQGGIRLHYSQIEDVQDTHSVSHPLIRNALKISGYSESLELGSFADVPGSGTGLGSSSAFTAAVLHSLHVLSNKKIDKYSLAQEVCHVEIDLCGEPIGKQDQFATVFGGINRFHFQSNGEVTVDSLSKDQEIIEFLSDNLLLVYLGFGRSASDILSNQTRMLRDSHAARQQTEILRDLVPRMLEILKSGSESEFGRILDFSWKIKSNLSNGISNSEISRVYELTLDSGSLGGKVLGAGGGGFLLSVVPPENRESFKAHLKDFKIIDFQLDHFGTQTVYTSS